MRQIWILCFVVVLFDAGSVTADPHIYLEPAVLEAQPGGTVTFKVFVKDTVSPGAWNLSAYLVTGQCDGSPIIPGSVSHDPTPGIFTIPCPGGTSPCVNTDDSEWAFYGSPNIATMFFLVSSGACPIAKPHLGVFTTQPGDPVAITTQRLLLGEIAYKISADAGGNSSIAIEGPTLTFLTSDTGADIPYTMAGAVINITEACCTELTGPLPTCIDTLPAGCTGPDDTQMGPGTKCTFDGTLGTPDGIDDACQSVVVPPGQDEWFTPDDGAQFDFCDTPIPAGFFDLNSQPFLGIISFGGGASPGGPDTIVQRLGNLAFGPVVNVECPFEPCMADAHACALGPCNSLVSRVEVEIAVLDLVSTQPIEVEMCTGSPELWTVDATLSGLQEKGALCACRTGQNVGRYMAEFPVQAKFTFCKVSDPAVCVLFDTAAEGLDPITLRTIGLSDFAFRSDLSQPFSADNFAPGMRDDPDPDSQCCKLVCHDAAGGFLPGQPPPPGHQHCANGRISCDACLKGACCDQTFPPFGCIVVPEADCPPGMFKGAGTNCDDLDADLIPDVLETGDCCELRSSCGVPSNPNMFDTDSDGCSDFEELSAVIPTDSCDACEFPRSCIFQPAIVADCNDNTRDDTFDIQTGCSVDFNFNGVPDECECPPPCASPPIKTYCLAGTASGMGWSWCVGDGSYNICDLRGDGLGVCEGAAILVPPFVASINDFPVPLSCGAFSATEIFGTPCFTIEACSTPPFDLSVGDFGQLPGCVVGPCEFNPTIVEVDLSGNDCDGNGIDDAIDIAIGTHPDVDEDGIPDVCLAPIPTVSQWGLIIMSALLLVAGTVVTMRRRVITA